MTFDRKPDVYKKDNTYIDYAFGSCTTDVEVLSVPMFLGKTGNTYVSIGALEVGIKQIARS